MHDRFVDPAVIKDRFERLHIVVEHSALLKHQARIGRIEEVLVEGLSRKDVAQSSARTRQNKLVHFVAPQPLRPGTYATVEITGAAPHHLLGRFVELIEPARHITRIPVLAG